VHCARRRRRGQSLVEFALIFPVMLLLVAGGVDLARIYFAGNETQDAAREAALYASHNPNYTNASLQSIAQGAAGSGTLHCANAVAVTTPAAVQNASPANTWSKTVKVSCDVSLFLGVLGIPKTLTMSSTVTAYVVCRPGQTCSPS
jgi:Flp pilus assembly protein TadG